MSTSLSVKIYLLSVICSILVGSNLYATCPQAQFFHTVGSGQTEGDSGAKATDHAWQTCNIHCAKVVHCSPHPAKSGVTHGPAKGASTSITLCGSPVEITKGTTTVPLHKKCDEGSYESAAEIFCSCYTLVSPEATISTDPLRTLWQAVE